MKIDDQIVEIYKLRIALNDLRNKIRLNQISDTLADHNFCSETNTLLEKSIQEITFEQSQYLIHRTTELVNKEYNLTITLGSDADLSGVVLYRNQEEDENLTLFWAKNSSGLKISVLT